MRIASKLNPHRDYGQRALLQRVMIIVAVALAISFAWVVFTTFWIWRNQEHVVFQPPLFQPSELVDSARAEFPSADGHPLSGYVIRPPTSTGTVVVAFHGNADIAAWFLPWARELARRTGVLVFVPEYRGYAGVPGSPSYVNAALDARGALRYAQQLVPNGNVVLYGHSLGTAIATDLAAWMRPESVAALVLESPFTSALDMAARMLVPPVPWLWRRISRVHYDTRTLVSQLDIPVWVAHGTRDVVVPARMGKAVFAAARNAGALLIVDGAGHNDVPEVGGERYWGWLSAAVLGVSRRGP
jgi:fermentation-respiration switch protein FrsA (DUF1100 family)